MLFSLVSSILFLLLSTILLGNAFGFEEQSFMIGEDDFPNSVAINPNKDQVFVGNFHYNGITIIDIPSGKTNFVDLGKMNYDSGDARVEIVFNEKANEIYAISPLSRLVSVIDASNYSVVNRIDLGEFNSGYSLVVNKNTNTVYVVSDVSGFLSIIAGNRETITDRIDIGSHSGTGGDLSEWVPAEISVNPSTNQVFLTNFFSKTVSVVDGKSNEIIKTISLEDYPTGVKINEKTNEIFVFGYDWISKFDGNDWKLIYDKKGIGGQYNKKISIDPQTNLIYLAYVDSPVSIIDGNTGDLVSVIDVVYPNNFIQVDPDTKKVYLGTEGSIEILDKMTIEPKQRKHFEPPLKQAKDGIAVENIKCNEGFVMVLKKSTTLPACVKPETAAKLIERGWAKSL